MKKSASSKKASVVHGFRVYRDAWGRFVSKSVYDGLSRKKRSGSSVQVKRDSKGRFVAEKFFSLARKVVKEKVKPRAKPKAKPRAKPKAKLKAKLKVKPKAKPKVKCTAKDYRNIFEQPFLKYPGHYNVDNTQRLRTECLAILIADQIKRGALRFRLWYRVPSSPAYPTGAASTEPFWAVKFKNAKTGEIDASSIYKFLQRIGYPVYRYWFRTKDFKSAGIVNLHGTLYVKEQ